MGDTNSRHYSWGDPQLRIPMDQPRERCVNPCRKSSAWQVSRVETRNFASLQLRYKSQMPKRMRAYAALAEEKYQLPTYPVLVNILKESDAEIPTHYESNFAGLQARQDYRVINLWEVDVEIAFTQPIPSLLPFVPILKGGAEESTIQQALQILRASEQLSQLETVLGFFASFVLDSALVQQIMRWDMAVLSESPWYQQIFSEGEPLGEKM